MELGTIGLGRIGTKMARRRTKKGGAKTGDA